MLISLLPHIAGHLAIKPSTPPTAPGGADQSSGISALAAALIGVAGSVVGGAVGGVFALLAVKQQSRRERESVRRERSHQAAMDIATAWTTLEEAYVARAAGANAPADLHQAFNAFSKTATTQSIAITDAEVRRWIQKTIQLAFSFTLYANEPSRLQQIVEALRQYGDAMREAIAAHYNDLPIPAFADPMHVPVPELLGASAVAHPWWKFWNKSKKNCRP